MGEIERLPEGKPILTHVDGIYSCSACSWAGERQVVLCEHWQQLIKCAIDAVALTQPVSVAGSLEELAESIVADYGRATDPETDANSKWDHHVKRIVERIGEWYNSRPALSRESLIELAARCIKQKNAPLPGDMANREYWRGFAAACGEKADELDTLLRSVETK